MVIRLRWRATRVEDIFGAQRRARRGKENLLNRTLNREEEGGTMTMKAGSAGQLGTAILSQYNYMLELELPLSLDAASDVGGDR